MCSWEQSLGERHELSSERIIDNLLISIFFSAWSEIDLYVSSLEWHSSLEISFVRILGQQLEHGEQENEGSYSNAGLHEGSLRYSLKHLERALGVSVRCVHVLSKLEIEKGHLVICEMGSKLYLN